MIGGVTTHVPALLRDTYMAEPNYYYNKGGTPTGPITIVELKELATSGQVKPTDLVWREGTPSWVPAATVKGLFSSTAPAAGSPPPPPTSSGPPPISATSSGTSTPPPASRTNWSTQSEDAKAAAEYVRHGGGARPRGLAKSLDRGQDARRRPRRWDRAEL